MKCTVCHRTLKSKESIKRGAGRVCFKKLQGQSPNGNTTLPEWQEISQIAVQSNSPMDWYMSLEPEQIERLHERMKTMEGSMKEKLQSLYESFNGGSNLATYAPINPTSMEDVEIGEPQILPSDITFHYQENRHATASAVGSQIVYGNDVQTYIENQENEEVVRHVLYHELGHVISNAFPSLERHIMDNPQGRLGKINLRQGRFEGLFGNYSPEEGWADGFAVYFTSPTELRERYPEACEFVDCMVREKIGMDTLQPYLDVVNRQLNEWYNG